MPSVGFKSVPASRLWVNKRRSVQLHLYLVLVFCAVVSVSMFWMCFVKMEFIRSHPQEVVTTLKGNDHEHVGPNARSYVGSDLYRKSPDKPIEQEFNTNKKQKFFRKRGPSVKGEKKFKLPPIGERYAFENDKVLSLSLPKAIYKPANVAIGCAITSRGLASESGEENQSGDWSEIVRQLPLFHQLLPSFCETASIGYRYRFYFSYDFDDPWLSVKDARRAFADIFFDAVDALCHTEGEQITVDLKFKSCNHSGSPAWAQNDAMMEAYNDDVRMKYFYRVNDDTVLVTPGWTESYIQVLNQFDPPNIGVVGPNFKTNGTSNNVILTYDFVHRSHLDIFHYYYPRELKDWFADDWITHVHQPRSVRVKDIAVMHTKVLKTRYKSNPTKFKLLDGLIKAGREQIAKWVSSQGKKSKKRLSLPMT